MTSKLLSSPFKYQCLYCNRGHSNEDVSSKGEPDIWEAVWTLDLWGHGWPTSTSGLMWHPVTTGYWDRMDGLGELWCPERLTSIHVWHVFRGILEPRTGCACFCCNSWGFTVTPFVSDLQTPPMQFHDHCHKCLLILQTVHAFFYKLKIQDPNSSLEAYMLFQYVHNP